MNQQFLDNNYLFVENFLEKNEALNLYERLVEDTKSNPQFYAQDEECLNDFNIYNYKPFLILLCQKLNDVSNLVQETLLPTYTYARLYKNGSILKPHKDRPSCDISVTLHLGGDAPWPIWFTKPNNEKVSVTLNAGQAVIYAGTVSEHWRDPYIGNNYGQVFLHYVRANSENWQHYFDRINNGHFR